MAGSSFSGSSPFLTYLTVFRSRLANANLVLPLSGFAFQSPALLTRRTKEMLGERTLLELAEPANTIVFQYLLDKNVVSSTGREKGRYKEFTLRSEGDTWEAKDRRGQTLQR